MSNEIDLGQQHAQSFETYEEALEALHKYAQAYAAETEDPEQYEVFMGSHLVLEIQQTSFAIGLKQGVSPFTFTAS